MSRQIAPVLALLLVASCGTRKNPLRGFPRVVLWAGERPEHLLYIDPHTTGVAFLARTITSLELPPGTVVKRTTRTFGTLWKQRGNVRHLRRAN